MKKFIGIVGISIFLMYPLTLVGCKSNQKRVAPAKDFIVDDTYNPDDYYYSDGGYSDMGGNYANSGGDSTSPAPSGDYYYTPPPANNDLFESIKNRRWQLIEIRINYGLIALDRQQMAYNNLNDVYIIQFTDDGVTGKAAPNRYFAPYEKREGKNITIRQIVGTLMTSNINVGGLMENEYYWYLQRITRFNVNNGYLELYATPSANEEIVLRYRAE